MKIDIVDKSLLLFSGLSPGEAFYSCNTGILYIKTDRQTAVNLEKGTVIALSSYREVQRAKVKVVRDNEN